MCKAACTWSAWWKIKICKRVQNGTFNLELGSIQLICPWPLKPIKMLQMQLVFGDGTPPSIKSLTITPLAIITHSSFWKLVTSVHSTQQHKDKWWLSLPHLIKKLPACGSSYNNYTESLSPSGRLFFLWPLVKQRHLIRQMMLFNLPSAAPPSWAITCRAPSCHL